MRGRILIIDDLREELESLQLMIKVAHPEYLITTAASVP